MQDVGSFHSKLGKDDPMSNLNQLCLALNPTNTMAAQHSLLIFKLGTKLATRPPLLLFTQLPSSPDLPHQCPSNSIFASVLAALPLPYGLIHSVGETIGTEGVAVR